MIDPEEPRHPAEGRIPDPDPIRRRLNREYVLTVPPARLDAATTPPFVHRLWDFGTHCDLIVDVRDVEHCDPSAIEMLDRTAAQLRASDVRVVVSHPSAAVERALAAEPHSKAFVVRRHREPRPLRRSTRGQL